jgi:hypothetical protein
LEDIPSFDIVTLFRCVEPIVIPRLLATAIRLTTLSLACYALNISRQGKRETRGVEGYSLFLWTATRHLDDERNELDLQGI